MSDIQTIDAPSIRGTGTGVSAGTEAHIDLSDRGDPSVGAFRGDAERTHRTLDDGRAGEQDDGGIDTAATARAAAAAGALKIPTVDTATSYSPTIAPRPGSVPAPLPTRVNETAATGTAETADEPPGSAMATSDDVAALPRRSSRREALGALAGMVAAACVPPDSTDTGSAAVGPTTTPPSTAPATTVPGGTDGPPADLLADKVTFGPTPALLATIRSMGSLAWIDRQLEPTGLYDASDRIASFATLTNTDRQNRQVAQADGGNKRLVAETDHASILRAIFSEQQLREMMCDLWVNHFNVWRHKNWMAFLYPRYREMVIRPHALGRFSDLLAATTRSVAMLNYLDNITSDASRPGGVNENYARELMELHTLGIIDGDTVHSEADVRAVARLLSGWGLSWDDDASQYTFRFHPWAHDRREVSVFGGLWTRPARAYGEGFADGVDFVDHLAHHERTAHHIALKLCRRFVGDRPSSSLVDSTAEVFGMHDTQIAPTLRHILLSDDVAAASKTKVRRPLEALVATLRSLEADVPTDPLAKGSVALRSTLDRMGQPIHERPSPDGYPDVDGYWVGSDGLLTRWSFAATLARNRVGGSSTPLTDRVAVDLAPLIPSPLPATVGDLLDALAIRLAGAPLPPADRNSLCSRLGVASDTAAPTLTSTDGAIEFVLGILLSHPTYHRR